MGWSWPRSPVVRPPELELLFFTFGRGWEGGGLIAAFAGPPFGERSRNLHALTCCHGDEYHAAATLNPGWAGQAPLWQVSSKSRFGFLILRHLRSGKVSSFPWKGFSLHFISLFLTPKPQVLEH